MFLLVGGLGILFLFYLFILFFAFALDVVVFYCLAIYSVYFERSRFVVVVLSHILWVAVFSQTACAPPLLLAIILN